MTHLLTPRLAARRLAMLALLAPVAVAAPSRAQGPALETLPHLRSRAVIEVDPSMTGEATGHYVTDSIGDGSVPSNLLNLNSPVNVNQFLGVGRFHGNGLTGSAAIQANIEAGHIWGGPNGHETLGHTRFMTTQANSANQVDRHATWVATAMGGRPGGAIQGEFQRGIAPDSTLYSGAIASGWNGAPYALGFSFFFDTVLRTYREAFTGLPGAGRAADVINSSWGSSDPAATGTIAIGLDGLANANTRTLVVASAGNSGAGPNQVGSPASAYNTLSVAALQVGNVANPFTTVAGFSSGGPNNYADPVNGTAFNARQVVDIAAPGTNMVAAYYGGRTGGNGPALGPPSGPLGGTNFYTSFVNGTSFAAPTVAGGAALLFDAGHTLLASNPDARDARVIKAVLMNSADKTFGWNNGQVANPNGLGGVVTTQGLDNRVGTGRMNLDRAFDQYLAGTRDVAGTTPGNQGVVDAIGWDLGLVAQGVNGGFNDYFFAADLLGGSLFTATLTWFRDRRTTFGATSGSTVFDDSFDDLNLSLWTEVGGAAGQLISESRSFFNSSEHVSFLLPQTGRYVLRVQWVREFFDLVGDANQETYGLAWSATFIPEPGTFVMLVSGLIGVPILAWRSRRRRAAA